MLTVFSIPKPFVGKIAITQTNALNSWLRLHPDVEILLFGDERGTQEIALSDHRIHHIEDIKKNKHGTPFLNDVFQKATLLTKNNLLCYVSADIILLPSMMLVLEKLPRNKPFVALARRTDVDIDQQIDFSDDWEAKLMNTACLKGKLHGFSGLDIIIFPKHLPFTMPAFLVGRPGWDNGLIYQLLRQGVKIIDASPVITSIHQNHDYSHHREGKHGVWKGEEAYYNFCLAGGLSRMATIRNASLILTKEGPKTPSLTQRAYAQLSLLYPFRDILGLKRWLVNKIL